jgi:drug/metabolite transporter (DMT)-like permease
LKHPPSHLAAVLQAVFVAFLWSTSWVLIKIGLWDSIPALSFAGLRYIVAFGCLLLVALRPSRLAGLRRLSRRTWLQLIALGVLFYAATQGAQYVGLALLPAARTSS